MKHGQDEERKDVVSELTMTNVHKHVVNPNEVSSLRAKQKRKSLADVTQEKKLAQEWQRPCKAHHYRSRLHYLTVPASVVVCKNGAIRTLPLRQTRFL